LTESQNFFSGTVVTLEMKESVTAVQRDIANYVSELEQRIAQLEQSALRAETQPRQPGALASVNPARKQLDEIRQAVGAWMSGDLEREVADLESQLTDFTSRQLPEAIEPLSKSLDHWKTRFNAEMSDAAKQYQSLSQMLDIDLIEFERAAKAFSVQQRRLASLTRDINGLPLACDSLAAELEDLVDTEEREVNVALAGLTQQLQIDVMRAKVTTDSTLSFSISNSQSTSMGDFFKALQADVNAQCAQMEESIREVQALLEATEVQWATDVERLQEDIKTEIGLVRQAAGTEVDLRQKLGDARAKMARVSELVERFCT
jgi:hypothetical protein